MPSTVFWSTAGALVNDATTELNSLANAAFAFGTAIANQTALNRFAEYEIIAKFASRPTATNPYINLYLIPALFGATYTIITAGTAPAATLWAGSFPIATSTGPQRSVIPRVMLPPLKYKIDIENKTGKSLAATGTTVRHVVYNERII